MRTLENTLALWVAGLLTSGEVVDWANSAIARSADPSQDLFDLASDGPERCLKRAREDFGPRPATLGYAQEFSLRALATPWIRKSRHSAWPSGLPGAVSAKTCLTRSLPWATDSTTF
jgi:hypothetical protein